MKKFYRYHSTSDNTSIKFFSKRQDTVKTEKCESEYVSVCTSGGHIFDSDYTLRILGFTLIEPSWILGDNISLVNSSVIPHIKLHKSKNVLNYHRVWEEQAYGIVIF